jgi:hypothetical protein
VSDVLLLSLGTTLGWRMGDALFAEQLERSGVSVTPVAVRMGASGRLRRAYPVTDLVEALAARRALAAALDRERPRAIVISTTTAAMLADPRGLPYVVRLDAPASMNRPGARNAVLHALERRALAGARLILTWSNAGRAALPDGAAPAVVVPGPIVASGPQPELRERAAVAYTPDVKAKGLDIVCAAWASADIAGARLDVFGVDREAARAHLDRSGIPLQENVQFHGKTPPERFRAALRGSLAYVGGARWEDYGQAPLEALVDGALLVTVPSGGPFEALAMARVLAPDLVATEVAAEPLAVALRRAFELPAEAAAAYRARAATLLEPFRPDAIERTLATEVVPALLG